MDIKDIALRLLAEEFPGMHQENQAFMVEFAEALISAYKAELLKEVGEPVLYAEFAEDGGWLGDASEYADHLEEPHALFTSDQVAATVAKATGPLEEKVAEWKSKANESANQLVEFMHGAHSELATERDELRTQLAASQAYAEQLREAAKMAVEMIETNAHERRHVRWKLNDALANPISTEALDAYVAEKVKEIIESHAPEGRNVTNAQHVEMRHKFVEQIATLTRQRDLAVYGLNEAEVYMTYCKPIEAMREIRKALSAIKESEVK